MVYVFYGALSLVFCEPLFAHPAGLGIFDWDQHLFYYAEVLKNVVEYGQPPFWSPWYCGGNVLWQNPQIALVSPAYPLTAIMPLALAMKINIVLHYWIALIGMHLVLTRVIGLSFLPGIIYLASVFTFAGGQALHLGVGHSVFLPAFYVPLQLFFFLRGLKTGALGDALLAAAILALMVYNGGLHVVPIACMGIGSCASYLAVARRSWRPIVLAGLLGVAGGAYAAPKLLPVAHFVTSDRFWDTRPPIEHPDRMSIEMVWHAYTDSHQGRESRFDGQRHGWWEYGNYIGLPAVLVVAASIVWVLVHRRFPEPCLARSFAVTALFLFALSAGEFNAFAPASLINHVPILSKFRIPSRYAVSFVLFGALTAGTVASALAEKIVLTRARKALLAAFCILSSFQLIWVNRAHFQDVFRVAPLNSGFRLLNASRTLVTDRDISPYTSNSPMLRSLMNDRAVFYCYEALQLVRGADPNHDLVFADGKSKISSIVFTPNRVQFAALTGGEPSRVFLNQNYAAGWRSSAGPVLLDPGSGTPYVTLAANRAGRFSFSFVPPGLIPGLALLAFAVGLSALAWQDHSKKRGVGQQEVLQPDRPSRGPAGGGGSRSYV